MFPVNRKRDWEGDFYLVISEGSQIVVGESRTPLKWLRRKYKSALSKRSTTNL